MCASLGINVLNPVMVTHIHNPRWEVRAGRPGVQGPAKLHEILWQLPSCAALLCSGILIGDGIFFFSFLSNYFTTLLMIINKFLNKIQNQFFPIHAKIIH